MKHGAKYKRCSIEECTNYVVKGGVCKRHGAEKKECRANDTADTPSSTASATAAGAAKTVGAPAPRKSKRDSSSIDDGNKTDGKNVSKKQKKVCSADGCTNQAHQGGVCKKHGAKKYRYECSADGCTNQVIKGGVCVRHGAKVEHHLLYPPHSSLHSVQPLNLPSYQQSHHDLDLVKIAAKNPSVPC